MPNTQFCDLSYTVGEKNSDTQRVYLSSINFTNFTFLQVGAT